MARGVNKVILVGNLGADPEVRYMPSGGAVAVVRLATSESWKDRQTGQTQERTEWHRVVFFAKLADVVAEYVKKGSKIYLEGRLRTNKWQDKEGNDRYTTEIVANEMTMLDSRGAASGGMGDSMPPMSAYENDFGAPSNGPANQPAQPAAAANKATNNQFADTASVADLDDDIPF